MYRPSHPATGVSYYSPPVVFPSSGYPFVGPSSYGVPYGTPSVCPSVVYAPAGASYKMFVGSAPGGVPLWQSEGWSRHEPCVEYYRQEMSEQAARAKCLTTPGSTQQPAPNQARPPVSPQVQPPQGTALPYWQVFGYPDASACATDTASAGWSQPDALSMCNATDHGYGTTPNIPLQQQSSGGGGTAALAVLAAIFGIWALSL